MERDRDKQIALFVGAGLGAALMFMLDPARGARRRALVRDKTVKVLRQGGRAIQDRSEDKPSVFHRRPTTSSKRGFALSLGIRSSIPVRSSLPLKRGT